MEQEWGEIPTVSRHPALFSGVMFTERPQGLFWGWGWGGLALLCPLGYHLHVRMGTDPLSPGHLHHHSLETQQLVLGNTGGWDGPNPPPAFLVDFSFFFFCGEWSLFLTLHSSFRWDWRLPLIRSEGQREGAGGSWRWGGVSCVSDSLRAVSAFPWLGGGGAADSRAPSAERSTSSPITGL